MARIYIRTSAMWAVIALSALAPSALASGAKPGKSSRPPALPRIVSAPAKVRPGEQVVLISQVPPRSRCRLTLARRAHVEARTAARHASSGVLEWVWTVPHGVRAGVRTAAVRCTHDRHVARARIHAVRAGKSHSRKTLAGRIAAVAITATEPNVITGLGAAGYPPYGATMVPGNAWFGGNGVNVYSNGHGDNLNGNYQCVELIERFLATEHFGPSIWGNANKLYANANPTYYDHHPNGSGYIPVPGDIIVLGGGPYGHVVIVDRVVGSTLYVVEQNASASGRSALTISGSTISGEYGMGVIGTIHERANSSPPSTTTAPPPPTSPPPTSAPSLVAPSGSQPQTYQVHGTGADGLYERTGPGTSYSQPGWLPEGATVQVACQTKSSSTVNGSPVWDLLTDGYFVSDYYIDTPVVGDYSPGIAQCVAPGSSNPPPPSPTPHWAAPGGSQPQTYHVHGTGSDGLYERTGPGTSYSQPGLLPEGATVQVACQTKSSSTVNGSPVWDLLTDGYFVSDYYIDTPVVGDYSPGIAQCVMTG